MWYIQNLQQWECNEMVLAFKPFYIFHLLEHIEFKHWLNQNSWELLCFKKENQTYLPKEQLRKTNMFL
jgi:hypothetical protein